MPRGNQTGPLGLGSLTGRRMGNCNSNNQTESGFGFGRGFRGRNNAGINKFRNRNNSFGKNFSNSQTSNKDVIESEIEQLKKQLLFLENEYKKFT